MNEKYIDKLFKLCSGEPLLWREVDGMIKQAMQRQREARAEAWMRDEWPESTWYAIRKCLKYKTILNAEVEDEKD